MKIQITIETEYDENSDPAPIRRELQLLADAVEGLAGFEEEKKKEDKNVGFRGA